MMRAALALAPFGVVGAVHVAALLAGLDAVAEPTKPLLMPLLAVGALVLAAAGERGRRMPGARVPGGVLALVLLALGLSFGGDVTLENVPLGLGFFLLAHLAWIAVYLRSARGRPSRWTLLVVPWFAALLVVLLPTLGGMAPLVIAYGGVLGAMAVVVSRGGLLPAVGGALFVVSDSILSLRLFTGLVTGDLADGAVMLTYLAAQLCLVMGVLRAAHRARGGARAAT